MLLSACSSSARRTDKHTTIHAVQLLAVPDDALVMMGLSAVSEGEAAAVHVCPERFLCSSPSNSSRRRIFARLTVGETWAAISS